MSEPQYTLYTEIVYACRAIVQLRFGENLNRPFMDVCISNVITYYMVVLYRRIVYYTILGLIYTLKSVRLPITEKNIMMTREL